MRRFAFALMVATLIGSSGCVAVAPGLGDDPELLRAQALSLLDEGDRRATRARPGDSLEPAIRAYRRAVEVDPLLFVAHLKLARCYYLTRQPELEQAEYRKALAVNPRCVEAWERLGHARLAQDDLLGARAAYEEVLKLEPQHAVVLYNLGLVVSDLGDFERARALFRAARRAPPR